MTDLDTTIGEKLTAWIWRNHSEADAWEVVRLVSSWDECADYITEQLADMVCFVQCGLDAERDQARDARAWDETAAELSRGVCRVTTHRRIA